MQRWLLPEFLVPENPNIVMEGPMGPRIWKFSLKRPTEKILNHTLKRHRLPFLILFSIAIQDTNTRFMIAFDTWQCSKTLSSGIYRVFDVHDRLQVWASKERFQYRPNGSFVKGEEVGRSSSSPYRPAGKKKERLSAPTKAQQFSPAHRGGHNAWGPIGASFSFLYLKK